MSTCMYFSCVHHQFLDRISSVIQGCNCSTHASGMWRQAFCPECMIHHTSMMSHLYQIRYDSHMTTPGCVGFICGAHVQPTLLLWPVQAKYRCCSCFIPSPVFGYLSFNSSVLHNKRFFISYCVVAVLSILQAHKTDWHL